MIFLIETSSSWAKPCAHHISAVVAAALAIWGRAKVPAATRPSELCSSERRVNLVISVSFRAGAAKTSPGVPVGVSGARLTLLDWVFGEDLLDPLGRLFRRRLRGHPALDDVHPAGHPGVLVLDLGVGRVEDPEIRHGRAEQTLLSVSRPVRVVEPPMV